MSEQSHVDAVKARADAGLTSVISWAFFLFAATMTLNAFLAVHARWNTPDFKKGFAVLFLGIVVVAFVISVIGEFKGPRNRDMTALKSVFFVMLGLCLKVFAG